MHELDISGCHQQFWEVDNMALSRKSIKKDYGTFVKEYSVQSRKNRKNNDRPYDRKLEEKIKKMRPEELMEILDEE